MWHLRLTMVWMKISASFLGWVSLGIGTLEQMMMTSLRRVVHGSWGPFAVVIIGQNSQYFLVDRYLARLHWNKKDWTLLSWDWRDLCASFKTILITILVLLYFKTYSWNSPMPILCYLLLLYPDFSLNLFFVDTDLSW